MGVSSFGGVFWLLAKFLRKESGGEEVVTTKSVVRLGAWDTEPVDGPFLLFYN